MNHHFELLESIYRIRNLHLISVMPDELTHGEFFALVKILHLSETCNKEDVNVSELTKISHVSKPAVSRTIKQLEKEGYVVKKISERDKRNNIIELTDKSHKLIARVAKEMEEYSKMINEKMGKERIDEFISFLDDLYEITYKDINKKKNEGEKNE